MLTYIDALCIKLNRAELLLKFWLKLGQHRQTLQYDVMVCRMKTHFD